MARLRKTFMKPRFHDIMKADFYECNNWLPDCVGCSSPSSCFVQLVYKACACSPDNKQILKGAITLAKRGVTCDAALLFMMTTAEVRWCIEHKVLPQVEPDVFILRRAIQEDFTGKKLEKALYKVRHRDLYLAQKKRNRERHKERKKALEAS